MKNMIRIAIAALLVVTAANVRATDLLVPGQYATLQEAHDAAVSGDRIIIGSGIYNHQVSISKSLTFSGPADGATSCSVGRMVIGGAASVVRLERLRFQGHAAPASEQDGGAVRIFGGQISIHDCVFSENFAYAWGGAVMQWGGVSDIVDCVFERNATAAPSFTYNFGGGAIAAKGGSLDIHRCAFIDNSAGPGNGGAINGGSGGTFRIWACVFCGGTAERGAAAIHLANFGEGNIFRRCTGAQFVVTGGGNPRCVAIDCAVSGAIHCAANSASNACDASVPAACASSLDCDQSGLIDVFEIAAGVTSDCNTNGTIDSCEIAAGSIPDCNQNGVPDSCDIAAGVAPDFNGNGVPDVCESLTCHDADWFHDGQINGADLGILLSQWGQANATTVSDINHDGRVDGADLGFLLAQWGICPN